MIQMRLKPKGLQYSILATIIACRYLAVNKVIKIIKYSFLYVSVNLKNSSNIKKPAIAGFSIGKMDFQFYRK